MLKLAALMAAVVTAAPPLSPREVRVADLLGQSPDEVASVFQVEGKSLLPVFVAQVGGEVVDVRQVAIALPDGCRPVTRGDLSPRVTFAALEFRNGRLVSVTRTWTSPAAGERRTLPLAGGVGAWLQGLESGAYPADADLTIGCSNRALPAPAKHRSKAAEVVAAPFVGAATLVSFAYWSPFYLVQGVRDARQDARLEPGRRLLQSVRLGESFPGGNPAGHPQGELRWYADPQSPDYGVATIDIKVANRGVTPVSVGVRDGRVEWLSAPGRMAPCPPERPAEQCRIEGL